MNEYEVAIGLEMHCELKSKSKVFSAAKNQYETTPNINVVPLDMGFPGTLPVVNKKCVENSLKMAHILNCEIADELIFDRKNYYYPDLPKGYQITQATKPIGINGKVLIPFEDTKLEVFINDIHLEEDSASLDHLHNITTIDYNRSGVPLLEVVTAPCFHTAKEALAFLEFMINAYRYCDISEADTKKGQVRCDVNVSIREKDSSLLGTKVEVKNVNSLSNIEKTINYEIKRQIELKKANRYQEIEQETRRFDEEKEITVRMRSKVDAVDYKYFVEPNIPLIKLDRKRLEDIIKEIPLLQNERYDIYLKNYGLNKNDAQIIVKDIHFANYFEECINIGIEAKNACNWLITHILGYLNKSKESIQEFYLTPTKLKVIIDHNLTGKISGKQAKDIFNACLEKKIEPENLLNEASQISDYSQLDNLITTILKNNQSQIEAYHNGKNNLFDYFVGQVMKETKGKANPIIVKEILTKKLKDKK